MNNDPGAVSLEEAPKSPNNVASTFFNEVDLGFEQGGAKVVSCPGWHLTLVP